MPTIGDTKMGWEIGKHPTERYYWVACNDCGWERWVGRSQGKSHKGYIVEKNKCNKCRQLEIRKIGVANPNWRGGRTKHKGYYRIYVGHKHYVFEHRLVMEQHLHRELSKDEVVHHLNGTKSDNRIENLVVISKHEHSSDTYIKLLQQRIRELESQ